MSRLIPRVFAATLAWPCLSLGACGYVSVDVLSTSLDGTDGGGVRMDAGPSDGGVTRDADLPPERDGASSLDGAVDAATDASAPDDAAPSGDASGADDAATDATPSCVPTAASDSTCDDLDDDCDGQRDEDFVPSATSCGAGVCAATGATRCSAGNVVDSCTQRAASAEVCDGLDNDCDTQTDDGVCPADGDGFVFEGKPYVRLATGRDFSAAQSACTAVGLRIAIIDSQAEQDALWSRSSNLTTWLGGTDAVSEGVWRWVTGVQFWSGTENGTAIQGVYQNWEAGIEPQNSGGVEDCTVMFANHGGGWADDPCDLPHPVICETP